MAGNNSPSVPNSSIADPGPQAGAGATSGSATTGGTPVPSGDAEALAYNASSEVIADQQNSLAVYIVHPTSTKKTVVPHTSADIVTALGGVLKLTAVRPAYASFANPATGAALVDRLVTGDALITEVETLLTDLKATELGNREAAYGLVRAAYNHATHVDPTDSVVQGLMAPAAALFARRSKTAVAAARVGDAVIKQAKAQARVNKTTTEATAAQQRLNTVVQTIVQAAAPAATTTAPAPSTTVPPASTTLSTTTPTR